MTREEMLNECVSRDKAIVQLNHLKSDWDDDWNIAIRKCIETIKKLPSVTAQPKMGRWVRMSDLSEDVDDRYKCSKCGNVVHSTDRINLYTFHRWCGRCGSNNDVAKMQEVEE